jgi:putative FmdB family regulatory protein
MPLYDFKCRSCGHRFEELVRLGEAATCPKCQTAGAERQFSPSAGISTETTRGRSKRSARRVSGAIKREKDAADREYHRNYVKEHSNTD